VSTVDALNIPKSLLPDDTFYSVMRTRVAKLLRDKGYPDGGPTNECLVIYWVIQFSWFLSVFLLMKYGTVLNALFMGYTAALGGAFGHNWIHIPKYKWMAYLCLDLIGFSSDGWYREHNLQHHMYTNTPWDNHYHGTDPFLVTEPTKPRHFLQKYLTPFINPIILSFGVVGNYINHTVKLHKG
jgi:fatty acid desaturase